MNIEQIQEELCDAMQSDMEHGVAWMNDEAWAKFHAGYPCLSKLLTKIAHLELEGEEDEAK